MNTLLLLMIVFAVLPFYVTGFWLSPFAILNTFSWRRWAMWVGGLHLCAVLILWLSWTLQQILS